MVKVLWISRHDLDQGAIGDLKSIYGEVEVVTKDFLFDADGRKALQQLLDISSGYNLVGGVFPSQLWIRLCEKVNIPFRLFVVVSVPIASPDGTMRQFMYDHVEIV